MLHLLAALSGFRDARGPAFDEDGQDDRVFQTRSSRAQDGSTLPIGLDVRRADGEHPVAAWGAGPSIRAHPTVTG